MVQEHIVCECRDCRRAEVGEANIRVLELMAEGNTIDQMAEKLAYSPASIKRRRRLAYRKLKVSTGYEAIAKAIKRGLI